MSGIGTPILKVEGLKKYFPVRRGFFQRVGGHVRAVDGVDLDIPAHQTLGLVGESGCGKSTVARLIVRLLTPDEGRICFGDREITELNEHQFKPLRKEIQMIFQDPYSSLNPRMTVAQSIGEGVRMSGITAAAAQRRRIAELLEMVGMPKASAERYPHEFSGGQRQRIGIARALSVSPRLILCDEPISALDVSIQAQIINLLKDLQTELGLSYLFISHDLNVVSYICDGVKVMYRGKIVESAPADRLFDDPRHPYTLKLLAALPDTDSGGRRPQSEPRGEVENRASTCGFADQCSAYVPECDSGIDALVEVDPGHFVRCRKAMQKSVR
jgi:oligopeptide/dipeptide ABC transporter ATP-binding protein